MKHFAMKWACVALLAAALATLPDAKAERELCYNTIPTNFNNASLKDNPRAHDKGPPLPSGVEPSAGCTTCKSSRSFPGNVLAKKYEVGTQIPTLPFKTKTSWAGNINVTGEPLSNSPSLFFWLWGKDDVKESDDLVIWLNGGPGCSSLGGMIQENGPIKYQNVSERPFKNAYSWTRAANVLYVDQPVLVGFSTGKSMNGNCSEAGEQFYTFLENFYKVFPELKSKRLWLTGESFAGFFIPYFSDVIHRKGNPFNLVGGMIVDGVYTDRDVQHNPPALQFAEFHKSILQFNDSDIAVIKNFSDTCGATKYLADHWHFPPKGKLPAVNDECLAYSALTVHALKHNPDWYRYKIDINSPECDSPLGDTSGGKAVYTMPTWLDNKDIQRYIHAPDKKWVNCIPNPFYGGDNSPPPDKYPSWEDNLMKRMIERSKHPFMLLNGDMDAMFLTNGTILALQNLTWNGKQGFSKSPYATPLYDADGELAGSYVSERGLTFAVVPKSGHMMPRDTPSAALAAIKTLLGEGTFDKTQGVKRDEAL